MQTYSYLVWFLFAFAFTLIHARNIHFDSNNEIDDDLNGNEQQKAMFSLKGILYKPQSFHQKSYNLWNGEEIFPYEQERRSINARRAKAIIKGDPREFMG